MTGLFQKFKAKGKLLSGLFYRHIRVRVYAFELQNTIPLHSDLPILRKDPFVTDGALQAAMQEAGQWEAAELQRRQTLQDVCYLVLDGGRCVHYSWVTRRFRPNTEIGFEASLNENNPWIYNSYTAATHRGRRIYPQVISRIAEDAKKRGDRLVWIDVEDANRASTRGVAHAGFVDVAVFEKKILLSRFVWGRRQTIVNAGLGNEFHRLSPRWTHA